MSAERSHSPLSPAAIAALQLGNKIEAIKVTRRELGVDLKDAKDRVDAYLASHPELAATLKSQGSGALGWLLMLIVAIAAIVYFWPA